MKPVLAVLILFAAAQPAFAIPIPEIDGSLAVQFAALAGGLVILLKKKKR